MIYIFWSYNVVFSFKYFILLPCKKVRLLSLDELFRESLLLVSNQNRLEVLWQGR